MKELVERTATLADFDSPQSGDGHFRRDGQSDFPKNKLAYIVKLALTRPQEHAQNLRLIFQDLWLAGRERQQFVHSAEYYGRGVPKGDSSIDLIVPGFGAGGWLYTETKTCLKRAHYQPEDYPVRFNSHTEPVEPIIYKFVSFITKKREESGKKLTLTGHSKGGLLIYAAWLKYPTEIEESAKHLFLIGAPIPEWVNSMVAVPYVGTQFAYGADDFRFMQSLIKEHWQNSQPPSPEKVQVTTINSSNDRVIKGRYIGKPEDHFEVRGASHAGLLWNREVMRIKLARMAHGARAA